METGSHKPATRLHPYESTTQSTSRRGDNILPKGMDTPKNVDRPKCNGYVGRKNLRPHHRKQRNESSHHASWRIRTSRRIYAKRARRRKNERPT